METFYEKKPSEIATINHKATLAQPKNHPYSTTNQKSETHSPQHYHWDPKDTH